MRKYSLWCLHAPKKIFKKKHYEKIILNYPEIQEDKDKKAEYPFVCWNEADLRTYLIYNFLTNLENKSIEIGFIHSEFQIKHQKFKFENINEKWNIVVSKICALKGRILSKDIEKKLTDNYIESSTKIMNCKW